MSIDELLENTSFDDFIAYLKLEKTDAELKGCPVYICPIIASKTDWYFFKNYKCFIVSEYFDLTELKSKDKSDYGFKTKYNI